MVMAAGQGASQVLAMTLLHGSQQLVAGLLAAAAGLSTDPAMLMHLGMPLALIAAAPAGCHAGLQLRSGHIGVVVGLAAHHPQRGRAHIGAVQAQADALGQLSHILLRQAVVGAGGAGLGAVRQRLDSSGQHDGVNIEVAG